MEFFWRGIGIGFAIAAPVGPIGILCIRRSIADGRLAGFLTGLGAATADATYGAVAAFGLTAVTDALTGHATLIRLLGGAFLVVLAVRIWRTHPTEDAEPLPRRGMAAAYAASVALTLTNPTTILSFAAVFAGLGLGTQTGETADAGAMVAGVFLGSAVWWLLLSSGAGALRGRAKARSLAVVNRISAGVIGGFGIAAVVSVVA